MTVYFHYFVITCILEKGVAFRLYIKWNPTTQGCFVPSLVEIVKTWKAYRHTDGQTDDRRSEKLTRVFSSDELKINQTNLQYLHVTLINDKRVKYVTLINVKRVKLIWWLAVRFTRIFWRYNRAVHKISSNVQKAAQISVRVYKNTNKEILIKLAMLLWLLRLVDPQFFQQMFIVL